MWPFKKKQVRATSAELAVVMFEWGRANSEMFTEELLEKISEIWTLELEEKKRLNREILFAHLWMVSKILGEEKHVLDMLHETFYILLQSQCGNQEESNMIRNKTEEELKKRYIKYYEAWERGMMQLDHAMCEYFFPKRLPIPEVTMQIGIKVLTFMKITPKYRKEYLVVDA